MLTARKTYWMTLLTAMIVALTFSTVPAQAASAPSTVGVVDFTYLIDHHPDTAAANQSLKAEQETLKQEFTEKSAGLNDSEKRDLDRQFGQRLAQKRQELLKPILDKVLAAIQDVAKAKGLSTVLEKREVVWGGVDITQDVLTKINGK